MAEQNISNQNRNTPTGLQQPQQEAKKDITPFENLSQSVTSLGSRLRVLEERYVNIRKKTQMTDQNLLDFEKDIREEIHTINQDVLEIKSTANEIKENLISISSELKGAVKQSDLKVVEKYIDMWQPMNFVTKDEFDKYIENK